MKFHYIIILLLSFSATAQTYDVVIQNGKIVDGTGNGWFYGDVGIKGDKISFIGKINASEGAKLIDAKGLVVAPLSRLT